MRAPARHITSLHPVPLYAVILASVTSVCLLLIHLRNMVWQLWSVMLLILLVWSPIFVRTTVVLYRQYRWLALFFVLLVGQSVHYVEHIAQMIQIHLLGFGVSQAHGIIGQLDLAITFLFGRESELSLRKTHWSRIPGGWWRALVVRGEVGIGKSALRTWH